MTNLEQALNFTLRWEGGYVNDPSDPGGKTKYGISDRRDGKIDGNADIDGDGTGDVSIEMISLDQATEIYRRYYWEPAGCSGLELPLAVCVFDTAVNMGVSRALKFLQQTKEPIEYTALRRDYYYELATRRPAMKKYLKGWLNRIVDLRKLVDILQVPSV